MVAPTPTRSLSQQITAVQHASDVLRQDEEIAGGLAGAVRTLTWTDKNQAVIRAVVQFVKTVKGTDALAVLADFSALASEDDDAVELLREFRTVKSEHPEIISILASLKKGNMHVKRVELHSRPAPLEALPDGV